MTIAQILFIFFILVKINSDDQKCSNYLVYDLCNCENGPISFDERYCITCTEPKIIIDNFCYTPVDHCESYSVSEDHCFFCEEGYEMNDKGQCIQCSKGKIGRDNYCFTKIEHCVDYKLFTEGEKCMACEDGYITTKENTKCKEKKIIENCKNTDDENICIECNEEYELYDNGLKCIKKCNELSKIAPFGECIPRIDSCSIYNSDNTCEKCEENDELKDNSCNECSSGYGDGKICFPQIENCLYQIGEKCKECDSQYKKSDDEKSCEECEDNKFSYGLDNQCYDIIDHCEEISYEKYYSCEVCEKNYSLSEDKLSCIPCENNLISERLKCGEIIDNCEEIDRDNLCTHCKIDKQYYLTSGRTQCNECGRGKYLFNDECIDEIPNCVYYSSKTECSQCKENYKIVDGKCVYCHHPYYGTNGKTCFLYKYQCEKHDDNGNCIKYMEGYNPKDSNSLDKMSIIKIVLSFMIIISVALLFVSKFFIKVF